jgi:hypothetical protein
MIFLNLFIAILVDSFVGTSESFKLPVKQNDFDHFITLWAELDPDATGYIKIHEFNKFLEDLANTDADIFKGEKEDIRTNELARDTF